MTWWHKVGDTTRQPYSTHLTNITNQLIPFKNMGDFQTFSPKKIKFSNFEKTSQSHVLCEKWALYWIIEPPTPCVGGDIDESFRVFIDG